MNNSQTFLVTACLLPCVIFAQKKHVVYSPDKSLRAEVYTSPELQLCILSGSDTLLLPSEIGMRFEGPISFAENIIRDARIKPVTDQIESPLYRKKRITKQGNQLDIRFKGDLALQVRCYDDGVAYRFRTSGADTLSVVSEKAGYRFPEQTIGYAAYVNRASDVPLPEQYFNSFENTYDIKPLEHLNQDHLMILPFLTQTPSGKNICILETDLQDYPGMFLLNQQTGKVLEGCHAPVPALTEQGGHNNLQQLVRSRESYIARTEGTRNYPWRIFAVTGQDNQLLDHDLAYALAEPSRVTDISWIRPGKVAWDWWNDWNLEGVDFETGINNQTYKYYIDFAARHGIEYVILDEGWAVNKKADLMQVIPDIDLRELVSYANERHVDLILWAGYWAYHRDMVQVTRHYADMGVKGFKIDFLDRDDQQMINFMWDAAKTCADNKMLIDFHGCCKPFGLQRTFPNVINFEGVNGLEQLKWKPATYDQVTYDLTFPFIRMMAGPLDYTQGAMNNAAQGGYQPVYSKPVSQGTRCRQLATYVIFESPLNMLCDAPTNYEKEPECTRFIADIPTVWDDTRPLDCKITRYISMARKKGSTWYVGAINDWTSRSLELDLSFLDPGNYRMVLYRDGVNAHKSATDYVRQVIPVPTTRKLNISMAPGGGWVARIERY